MKTKHLIYVLCMATYALFITSCATIVSGGSPKIKLEGHANEPLTITTSESVYSNVYLPIEVKVKRKGLKDQRINITSNNYTYSDIVLGKRVNTWAFGNILAGGFIGWGVDLATNCVVVPKQKTFYVNGTPKNTGSQNLVQATSNEINMPVVEQQIQTVEQISTSVSSKTLKSLAQQIEGTYVGSGSLTLNDKTIEEYEGIKVIIKKQGNDIVNVQVRESNGEDFFYSPNEYKVSRKPDGLFELVLVGIPSAKIVIDKNGGLTYVHPRVNIEGDNYQLSINANHN